MNENQDFARAYRHLAAHFTPICLTCKVKGSPQSALYSAFVISIHDTWFLITAGHCLRNIHEALTSKFCTDIRAELLDAEATNARFSVLLPFLVQVETSFFIDERGMDYGVLPIRDIFRRQMERNGVRPIDELIWNGSPPKGADHWLLGVPEEFTKLMPGNGTLKIERVTCLNAVIKLEERPSDLPNLPGLTFFGRVELDRTQSSIVGMSGGPIFATKNNGDGTFTYWLIAIQSRWVQNSGHIAACELKPLAWELQKTYDELRNEAI